MKSEITYKYSNRRYMWKILNSRKYNRCFSYCLGIISMVIVNEHKIVNPVRVSIASIKEQQCQLFLLFFSDAPKILSYSVLRSFSILFFFFFNCLTATRCPHTFVKQQRLYMPLFRNSGLCENICISLLYWMLWREILLIDLFTKKCR